MSGLKNARALYLEAIRDGDYVAAINKYSGERYTQHSTPVKDGKEGFIEFFGEFVERNPIRDIEIVRSFQDGQYVFLHVLQNLNDGEFQYVTADIFDTDADGKLIEHWDIIEELRDPSQLDGPTEITNHDQTEANKVLVAAFLEADSGCTQVHNLIGCGNFVAALVERDRGGVPCAVVDLFNVEAGEIVRQWSVTEEITPESTWVNSGKF